MSTFPPTSPSKPYTEVRSSLGTGDLFFLHGNSDAGVMIEKLEELAGWPPYSHIGMVIADGDDLYLWDAPGGGDCFPDPYAGDPDNRIYGTSVHNGSRVSVLDDVLAYYATKVDIPNSGPGFWLRQLTPSVTSDRFGALRRFINRVDGQAFPTGKVPWIKLDPAVEGLGANFIGGQDKMSFFYGTYFCAQLVADSYMHMGLLEMEVFPPNGYSPAAFGMDDPNRLPLVKPAALSEPLFVTWDLPTKTGSGYQCPPDSAASA
jgi:hypothetical protein